MKYWETKDGKKLLAKDMTDSHILNSWEMFAHTGGERERFLKREAKKRKLKLPKVQNPNPRAFSGSISFANGLMVYEYGRMIYCDDGNAHEWNEGDDDYDNDEMGYYEWP